MSSSFESFVVTDALEQRYIAEGVQVPFVLSPPTTTTTTANTLSSPEDAALFVREHRTSIDKALIDRGVVLFRGFPLDSSAEAFDTFVSAWEGWQNLAYDKSMSFAVRQKLSNRICTTNEGKSGGLVFHHEQAQTPLWPSHLFFCCLLPAAAAAADGASGGATGIVSSHQVYQKIVERHPEFAKACETHGVRYTIYAGPEQDPTKGAGRSWKSFFHVTTKQECETKLKAGGWDWEWGVGPNNNGSNHKDSNHNDSNTITRPTSSMIRPDFLKCTTPVLDAVKVAPGTSKKCFFNQLIATTANALEFSRVGTQGGGYDPLTDIPTQEGIDACVCFGNGDQVPLDILLEAKQICEDLAIDIHWQKGDVALINNYLMMHARRPWNGPEGTRKLVASLVAESNCTSFGSPLVAM